MRAVRPPLTLCGPFLRSGALFYGLGVWGVVGGGRGVGGGGGGGVGGGGVVGGGGGVLTGWMDDWQTG